MKKVNHLALFHEKVKSLSNSAIPKNGNSRRTYAFIIKAIIFLGKFKKFKVFFINSHSRLSYALESSILKAIIVLVVRAFLKACAISVMT